MLQVVLTNRIFYFFKRQNPQKYIKFKLDVRQSKKISNDQELIQSDPTSCPQNQKGNN